MTEQPSAWGYSETGIVTPSSTHPAPPPEVEPARARPRDVDLLPRVLAHVADPQVSGLEVDAVAERVAQPVVEDLAPRAGPPDERVVRRDRVGSAVRRAEDVDAEHLAEDRAEVAGPVLG